MEGKDVFHVEGRAKLGFFFCSLKGDRQVKGTLNFPCFFGFDLRKKKKT